jgi:hypothetical protein
MAIEVIPLYLESFELNVIRRLPRLDGLAVFVVGLLAYSLQAKVGGTTSPADKASPTYRIERTLEEEETERERKDSPESMSLLGLQSWWLGESERAESKDMRGIRSPLLPKLPQAKYCPMDTSEGLLAPSKDLDGCGKRWPG